MSFPSVTSLLGLVCSGGEGCLRLARIRGRHAGDCLSLQNSKLFFDRCSRDVHHLAIRESSRHAAATAHCESQFVLQQPDVLEARSNPAKPRKASPKKKTTSRLGGMKSTLQRPGKRKPVPAASQRRIRVQMQTPRCLVYIRPAQSSGGTSRRAYFGNGKDAH